jgi:hypothetical protein
VLSLYLFSNVVLAFILENKVLDNIREQRLEQRERLKANTTLANKDPENTRE